MKKCAHVPYKQMIDIYGAIAGRFIVYAAFSYFVSMVFGYAYYHLVAGTSYAWCEHCPWMAFTGTAFGLVIGYFAVRDGLEANRADVIATFKALPPKG